MFNDLLEELQKLGFNVYAYADDLAITGISEDHLLFAIETCENWAARNMMTINKKKSGILLHNRKDTNKRVL